MGGEWEAACRLGRMHACTEASRPHLLRDLTSRRSPLLRSQDLALIRKLQSRIDAAAKRLQSELDQATRAALAGSNSTALAICLHAYASLGAPQAAEQVGWAASCQGSAGDQRGVAASGVWGLGQLGQARGWAWHSCTAMLVRGQ